MFWNHALDGPWMIVLGGLLMLSAWMLFRSHRRVAASERRDPLSEARTVLSAREKAESQRLNEMSVRLEELHREVEALTATRIAVLERLVADADREIARLIDAVAEARGRSVAAGSTGLRITSADAPGEELPGAERQMVYLLHEAGFEADEIARLVDQPTAFVAAMLEGSDGGLADAA